MFWLFAYSGDPSQEGFSPGAGKNVLEDIGLDGYEVLATLPMPRRIDEAEIWSSELSLYPSINERDQIPLLELDDVSQPRPPGSRASHNKDGISYLLFGGLAAQE